MDNFEWVDIPSFEGLYQVNEFGDIKSLNYRSNGNCSILKPRLIRGYYCVDIYKDKKKIKISNHQAVAMAFLGHTLGDRNTTVNHKDFDKLNNHKVNLEIVSRRDNSSYKSDRGSRLIGTCKQKNGKYVSKIMNNRKRYILGYYDSEIEANIAYMKALECINNGEEVKEYRPRFSSDVKGISYSKSMNRWIANLYTPKGRFLLGYFITESDAIAFLAKAKEEFELYGNIIRKRRKKISTKKGVTFSKITNKWGVRINGLFIGNYKTESEAISVSNECDKAILDGMTIREFKDKLKPPKPLKVKRITSSNVSGVTYKSTKGIWEAYNRVEGKRKYVGSFKTEADAIFALQKVKNK